jgi:hypothetical protein
MVICIIGTSTLTSEIEELTLSEIISDPSDGINGKFTIHSFIIRMWLEQSDEKARHSIWRGRITHLPGNEQQHFTDIKNIASFIKSYLKE